MLFVVTHELHHRNEEIVHLHKHTRDEIKLCASKEMGWRKKKCGSYKMAKYKCPFRIQIHHVYGDVVMWTRTLSRRFSTMFHLVVVVFPRNSYAISPFCFSTLWLNSNGTQLCNGRCCGCVCVCMWPQMKPNVFCMTHIFSRFCTALCCRCVVGFSTATLLRGFHECEWILRNFCTYWWDTVVLFKADNMVFLVHLNSQLTLVDKNSKLD